MVIDPRVELIAVVGRAVDGGERLERGVGWIGAENAILIGVLVAGEEEQPVLHDGTTKSEPCLAAREKRVGIERIALERGIDRQVVIAEIEEAGAMELVGSAAGDDIDCAARRDARGEIEIHGGDLELLHHFLREVLRSTAVDGIGNALPIDSNAGSVAKTEGWRFDTLERCPSPRLNHSNGATIPAT